MNITGFVSSTPFAIIHFSQAGVSTRWTYMSASYIPSVSDALNCHTGWFLDAIASPSSFPRQSVGQWVSEWVIDSFRCDAIASQSFASLLWAFLLLLVQFLLNTFDICMSQLSVELNYGQWIKELLTVANPKVGKDSTKKKSLDELWAATFILGDVEKLSNRLNGDHNSWSAGRGLLCTTCRWPTSFASTHNKFYNFSKYSSPKRTYTTQFENVTRWLTDLQWQWKRTIFTSQEYISHVHTASPTNLISHELSKYK